MIEKFTSYGMRKAPDQTTFRLNEMRQLMESSKGSIRVVSEDKNDILVIGNQPINPTTKKPYPFGICRYAVKGDRLELIGEVQWT